MSAARSPDASAPDPGAVASALREADFVRLCARPTGDAVAAAGLLARVLRDAGTPFHVRTTRETSAPDGDGTALALGWSAGDAPSLPTGAGPVSVAAAAVATELDADPDPLIGLAGVAAAGSLPGEDGSGSLRETAERRGLVERRPGVAVPTADPVEGLAGSTLLSAPFSGDVDAAGALCVELGYPEDPDADARRRLASVAALDATADAPPRAAGAVERAVAPYATPNGPFATLGGYADVLAAVARRRPGLGISLALGGGAARAAALDCWRDHGAAVHRLLADPTTARYDGAYVLRVDADPDEAPALATAARLARDFRSPEPVALVVSPGVDTRNDEHDAEDGEVEESGPDAGREDAGTGRERTSGEHPDEAGIAAAAGTGDADVTAALATAAGDGDRAIGDARRGEARFATGVDAFVQAFREAL